MQAAAPRPRQSSHHRSSREDTILRGLQTVRFRVFESQAHLLERLSQASDTLPQGLVLWTNSLHPAAENKVPRTYPQSPGKMSKIEKQPPGPRPLWPEN